jgi:hypothetical protein
MRAHFFVAPAFEELAKGLDALVLAAPPTYADLGQTFRKSLASTLSTVGLPFALATTSVLQSRYQRLHIAERIRALPVGDDDDEGGEQQAAREANAAERAEERLREFQSSKDGMDQLIDDTCWFLLNSLRETAVEAASNELIQQGVVLLWSAFEVFFRDGIQTYLNENAEAVKSIAKDKPITKALKLEAFTLETLASYDFNISFDLGNMVVEKQDFSDLVAIKTICKAIFPDSCKLFDSLNERDLWLLCQRRHVIVHNRGCVDFKYLDKTHDDRALFAPLLLTPSEFENHFRAALKAGEAFLEVLCQSRAQQSVH